MTKWTLSKDEGLYEEFNLDEEGDRYGVLQELDRTLSQDGVDPDDAPEQAPAPETTKLKSKSGSEGAANRSEAVTTCQVSDARPGEPTIPSECSTGNCGANDEACPSSSQASRRDAQVCFRCSSRRSE